ncbi:MAG: hypothetical protein ABJB86_19265 [Bacteroidota bacterium]
MYATFAGRLKPFCIYKQIAAFIFFAAFLAQTLNKAFVIADYYSNRALYAKNCENKAIPIMHCNGKCQMMKKLKEEQKKDEENSERRAENKNEVISFQQLSFLLDQKGTIVSKKYKAYQQAIPDNFSKGLFRPPQC